MGRRFILAAVLLAGCDLTVHAGGMDGGVGGGTGTGGGTGGGGSGDLGGSGGGQQHYDGGTLMQNNGDFCQAPLGPQIQFSGANEVAMVQGTTVGLTDDDGGAPGGCGGEGAPDIFYQFLTHAGDVVSATVTATSAGFQPVLKFRTASTECTGPDAACEAANAPGGAATISHFVATETTNQVIVVDGLNGTSGSFNLLVNIDIAPYDAGVPTGSCVSPADVTLPFSSASGATTAGKADALSVTCGAPANLPEAVYRVTLGSAATVHVTGSDSSGQGIGVEVHQDDCTGASMGCAWKSNGVLDEMFNLGAGTWVFVVERNPAGPFTVQLQ